MEPSGLRADIHASSLTYSTGSVRSVKVWVCSCHGLTLHRRVQFPSGKPPGHQRHSPGKPPGRNWFHLDCCTALGCYQASLRMTHQYFPAPGRRPLSPLVSHAVPFNKPAAGILDRVPVAPSAGTHHTGSAILPVPTRVLSLTARLVKFPTRSPDLLPVACKAFPWPDAVTCHRSALSSSHLALIPFARATPVFKPDHDRRPAASLSPSLQRTPMPGIRT